MRIWFALLCAVLISASSLHAQPFTLGFVEHELPDVNYAAVSAADVDGDGSLDLVLSGNRAQAMPFVPMALVAINAGGSQTEAPDGTLRFAHHFETHALDDALWLAAIAWTDVDMDNRPDMLITGASETQPPFGPVTRLYRNTGGGSFERLAVDFVGVHSGAASFADMDGDGDEDLLLTGVTGSGSYATMLYRRQDDGSFQRIETNLPGIAFGAASWSDVDGDGHLDLFLNGVLESGAFAARVYRNDGSGGFEEVLADLPGLAFGEGRWGDFDEDGDEDLLLTGGRISPDLLTGATRLYRNSGGSLEWVDAALPPVVYGTGAWGDYDLDGRLDALFVGQEHIDGPRLGRVYQNQPGGFTHDLTFPGASVAAALWFDQDGDRDDDLMVTGLDHRDRPITTLYRNTQRAVNDRPTVPGSLAAQVEAGTAVLSWSASEDTETATAGIRYNLRVGTAPGRGDVVSALADPESGLNYVTERSGLRPGTRRVLRDLPTGRYYWSVQAVDVSNAASPFAEEMSFDVQAGSKTDVESEATGHAALRLHPPFPNPFHTRTTFTLELPAPAPVRLTVYDLLGRAVSVPLDGYRSAGSHRVQWDALDTAGRPLPPGVYFARLEADQQQVVRRLVLVD